MATENSIQGNYDQNAEAYDQFINLPLGTLEQQLFDLSIVDCEGLTVLDLGGGTGARALDALRAGAAHVDVVDISPEMMRRGRESYERSIGHDSTRKNRISWYHGDASKPLDHLSLGPYDMVVANGVFDHAHTVAELDAMWRNAAAYLKPGGRVVANRNNPLAKSGTKGKYGVTLTDFCHTLPGGDAGLSFRYRMATDPPLVFESIALDAYYTGALDVPAKYFEHFETVPWSDTPVVKADPAFWRDYLNDPLLFIFTARKKR